MVTLVGTAKYLAIRSDHGILHVRVLVVPGIPG
jgi:hypothetical protein